jgi:hypothetical protein
MDDEKMQGSLYGALAKAQKAAKAVGKDATNTFHRYAYASAEAIYAECREHLSDHGLTVLPVASHIDLRDGQAILVRGYLLAHEGGGAMTCAQEWPVVPEKGRPLDKAVASADTTSLAYFLRSLLLLPRVDPSDDMDSDARGSSHASAPRSAPQREAPKPPEEKPPQKMAAKPSQPERITRKMMDEIADRLDALGYRNPKAVLDEVSAILDRPIKAGADLTVQDGRNVLLVLEARQARERAALDGEAA